MAAPQFWAPGTHILWRFRWGVYPMTVVADDERGLVAWLAVDTPILRPVLPDGRELRSVGPVEMYASGRALKRDTWKEHGTLRVAPTGAPWSMYVFWDGEGRHRCWYVNLEQPHVRDEAGIITEDHVLDLVVLHDRTVRWKDVDELAGAVEAERFTAQQADEFIADARAAEKLIADWASPFSDGWERWRPEASWPLPELPADAVADY
jgi:predicted RNA-binding protein associated with RNAse of E/G family